MRKIESLTTDPITSSTNRRQWRALIIALLILDALCVLGSLALAYVIRIDGVIPYYATVNNEAYRNLVILAVPLFLACFAILGLYQRDNLLGGVVEYKQVVKGCTAGLMLLVVYVVFARMADFDPSRGWLVLSWVLSIAMVGTMRFFVRRIVYRLREMGWLTSRVLIVGANDQGVAIAEQWMSNPYSGMQVVGFLDDFKTVGSVVLDNIRVIGRPSALNELSRLYHVDEVIVVSTAVAWESFGELVTRDAKAQGYILRLSPGFYELLTTGVAVTTKTFVPLLTIHDSRIVGIDAFLKCLLDYGLGGLLALVSLPFGVAIALALKLRNPHAPVLTRTRIIGRGGKPFSMLRFNTQPSPAQPSTGYSRGKLERWLRMTGLDKLPQLWNVLRGQMSLVGPRPRASLSRVTDMHTMHNLQAVKPGIVGPWMRKDHLASPDPLRDELSYIRNWQIWTDLPILFEAANMLFNRMFRANKRPSHPVEQEEEWLLSGDKSLKEDALY
ncbi:MAG: sugar transferase [Anaerolineae bacterium]|nr:sugar transferase [Candidatus Roseilinea sp.]MDW8451113.1 sugar transferase [Anaerolineae bacterium]